MNPTVNKSDFEDLTTNLRDLAYSYLEKYSPSKQQLKIYLLKKYYDNYSVGYFFWSTIFYLSKKCT